MPGMCVYVRIENKKYRKLKICLEVKSLEISKKKI